MSEIMAKAICAAEIGPRMTPGDWIARSRKYRWQLFVHMAQAAEKALNEAGMVIVPQEPTEAMVQAGSFGYEPDAKKQWQAMIDAALQPKEGEKG